MRSDCMSVDIVNTDVNVCACDEKRLAYTNINKRGWIAEDTNQLIYCRKQQAKGNVLDSTDNCTFKWKFACPLSIHIVDV